MHRPARAERLHLDSHLDVPTGRVPLGSAERGPESHRTRRHHVLFWHVQPDAPGILCLLEQPNHQEHHLKRASQKEMECRERHEGWCHATLDAEVEVFLH